MGEISGGHRGTWYESTQLWLLALRPLAVISKCATRFHEVVEVSPRFLASLGMTCYWKLIRDRDQCGRLRARSKGLRADSYLEFAAIFFTMASTSLRSLSFRLTA